MSCKPLIAFRDGTTGLVDEERAEDVYSDGSRALDMVSHSSISAAKVVKIGWTDGKLARLPNMISGVESNWRVIISGIPQQLIQGQMLINVSINEQSGGNDDKSSSSLQMTPVLGPTNKLEGRPVIQR